MRTPKEGPETEAIRRGARNDDPLRARDFRGGERFHPPGDRIDEGRRDIRIEKFQITNPKYQTNFNYQFPKCERFATCDLELARSL